MKVRRVRGITAAALGVVLGACSGGMFGEDAMAAGNFSIEPVRPAIDRAVPAKTERAVFALG